MDAFVKLGHGYAVFAYVNTAYWGMTSLFWILTKAAVADGLVQDQITDKVVVAEEGVAVKTLGRKSQPESVSCASSRGGGGGRGFRGAHDGRGGSGRGRLGVHPQQEVEEDELRNALDHEYMDQLIIEEEEKRLAR
nr:hypothetical protein [Tanacetum cinerariifolium]